MESQHPMLRRPNTTYKVVLMTPLTRKIFSTALGLANALTKLGLAARDSLPPRPGQTGVRPGL